MTFTLQAYWGGWRARKQQVTESLSPERIPPAKDFCHACRALKVPPGKLGLKTKQLTNRPSLAFNYQPQRKLRTLKLVCFCFTLCCGLFVCLRVRTRAACRIRGSLPSPGSLALSSHPFPSSFHGPPSPSLPPSLFPVTQSQHFKVGAEGRFLGQSSPVLVGLFFFLYLGASQIHASCLLLLLLGHDAVAAETTALNPGPAEGGETNWHRPSWHRGELHEVMAPLELWQEKVGFRGTGDPASSLYATPDPKQNACLPRRGRLVLPNWWEGAMAKRPNQENGGSDLLVRASRSALPPLQYPKAGGSQKGGESDPLNS